MKTRLASLLALGGLLLTSSPALAWDAYGHKLIARLAVEGAARQIGAEAPAWLTKPEAQAMIADQAATPDRWRSTRVAQLTHLNNPDHYLDIEELADYSMTLSTLPPLRHELVRQLSLAREKPGFKGQPVGGNLDPEHVREYPGFLPQVTLETWAKVVSSMRTARILERLNDPRRAPQAEMARASVYYNMGVLAHYTGDAAQPLHTTIHHHGWLGPNPKGYSTDRGIHAYIDGGAIRLHQISAQDVRAALKPVQPADQANPWPQVIAEIERSFAQVEPLYQLKKSGDLDREPGKQFLIERLADGAQTLGSLYAAAWQASAITPKDVEEFVKYDGPVEER